MTNNTNPSVASVSISANQITITGFSAGTTNITICGGGLGCSSIYVTVQSSTSNVGVTFSQNSVSVPVGQSQTIAISGFGPYYVSSNTYQGVVSTNINGSVLTIAGVVAGTDNINICSSATNDTSCGSISVTVTPSSFTNVSTAQPNLTFGQSNVTLNVGQTGAVAISGGSIPYYISNNQNPSSVGVNVSGTNVDVSGLSFGGDNITICAVGGPCGTLYVYVQAGAGGGVTPSPSTLTAPAISSFSVASNDEDGNFIGSGNILTITFSVNQSISIPKVTIGSTALTMNGSGNGPYTATYTMTGSETLPLSIAINFSNPAGSAGQADFWVGNNAVAPTTFETAAASTVLSSQTNNGNVSTTGYTFTQYLYDGSTGSQVTALQERLTTDGIYSGPITGTFGPLTKAAVKAYQAKHGLDQLGVVGPATRALLNRGI